ncbi:MAG: DUF6314 family protein [Pseudomonadota bacterium]
MAGLVSLFALAGGWELQRVITHDDGRTDRLTGTCRFTRSGPRLLQDEDGWLETTQGRFQASRRYVWGENNGRVEVFFADMRPFHSIPLGEAKPETVHLCPPDRYHVAYDFTAWPQWSTVWTVEGPRKDYVMKTRFTPDEGGGQLASARA